jgi:hypothetical protein
MDEKIVYLPGKYNKKEVEQIQKHCEIVENLLKKQIDAHNFSMIEFCAINALLLEMQSRGLYTLTKEVEK